MQQLALDGLVLPVHDHRLGALAAIERQIENCVVAGLRVQDADDLRGSTLPERVLPGAVNTAGILPLARTRRASFLLPAVRALRFQLLFSRCRRHKFDSFLAKNNLLTEVSS